MRRRRALRLILLLAAKCLGVGWTASVRYSAKARENVLSPQYQDLGIRSQIIACPASGVHPPWHNLLVAKTSEWPYSWPVYYLRAALKLIHILRCVLDGVFFLLRSRSTDSPMIQLGPGNVYIHVYGRPYRNSRGMRSIRSIVCRSQGSKNILHFLREIGTVKVDFRLCIEQCQNVEHD